MAEVKRAQIAAKQHAMKQREKAKIDEFEQRLED